MRTGCFMAAAFCVAAIPAAVAVAASPRVDDRLKTVALGEARPAVTISGLFPVTGAAGVCPDTPLRITFLAPPTLGTVGKIRIFDAASNAVVETIDVSSSTATKTIGGLPGYKYYPVIVSGNEAAIFPRNGLLSYNKTYTVTVDSRVFKDGASDHMGIAGPTNWRFATKVSAPAGGTANLTVAADGTGDFCTVQGALDFIPDGNSAPTTIFLRKGTYREIVFFTNKNAITLMGEDRKQSVIAYANNDRLNHSAGNPFADGAPTPSAAVIGRGDAIYRRGVLLAHRVNDLVVANLTIRNTTPAGGSQAEAIILNGTTTARAIIKDVDLRSTQDTLQINGQAYLRNCTIEGDVDFIWGTGPCFFESCLCRSLRSKGFYTQIRNPGTNHGFVFVRCTLDGLAGVVDNYLSRIKPRRFPDSEVVLIDCVLGEAVGSIAWQLQGDPGDGNPIGTGVGAGTKIRFWEFNSHDASGKPVNTNQRLAASRQLRRPVDAVAIANYGNPTFVLGNAWDPNVAPIFGRR